MSKKKKRATVVKGPVFNMGIYQLLKKSKQILVRVQSDLQNEERNLGGKWEKHEKRICNISPDTEKLWVTNFLFETHCETK